MTYAQIGAALGISKSAAHKRARRGMPVDNLEAARAWTARHADPVRHQPLTMTPTPDDDAPTDGDLEDYRRARADRERIRAEREQLELDRMRGQLGDIAEIARVGFTAWRALRDQVQSVPARVKDQLAAAGSADAIEALLAAELDAVLAAFDPTKFVDEAEDDE